MRRPPLTVLAQRLMCLELRVPKCTSLEFESAFTSSLSESLNATVIDVTAAVEDHGFNALGLGEFSNLETELLSLFGLRHFTKQTRNGEQPNEGILQFRQQTCVRVRGVRFWTGFFF